MKRNNIPWDPSEDALLGMAPDATIAGRVLRSVNAVANRRRSLGISPYTARKKWTEEELALLGTDSDANIGRRVGRSAATVAQKRYKEHVPAYRPPPDTPRGVIAERATTNDADVQPWRDQELAWLGILADSQVAARTGRSEMNIAATRRALGRASVDEIVAAITRCPDTADVQMLLCMWYGRMQSLPSPHTLIDACGIYKPTAYRQIARALKIAAILWPENAEPDLSDIPELTAEDFARSKPRKTPSDAQD